MASSKSSLLLVLGVFLIVSLCLITSSTASSKSDHRLSLLGRHLSTRSSESSKEEKDLLSAFMTDHKKRVLVSVELSDNYKRSEAVPLHEFITLAGGQVEGTINDRVVEAYIPLALLSELESHAHVHYINLIPPFMTSTGKATSQSGPVLGVPATSVNGLKLGIISDSVNRCPSPYAASKIGLNGSIATGDLPALANNVVLKDSTLPCGTVEDEGRAMAEIIFDIIFGVKFYYYMPSSPSDFAAGIRALKNQGCKVIVDDLRFLGDPIYQDSIVAQAVNEVTSAGVSYLTAAGNTRNAAYQANFTLGSAVQFNLANVGGPASKNLMCHKFSSGSMFLNLGGAAANIGKQAQFVLSWAVPYKSLGGPTNPIDLDLIVSSKNTNPPTVLASSGLSHGTDPYEYAPFTINANTQVSICVSSAVTLGVGKTWAQYIQYNSKPVQFKLMYNRIDLLNVIPGAPTIVSQQNAAGAITVGAIAYNKSCRSSWNHTGCIPVLESYSSLGGQPIYYTATGAQQISPRNKPDVTGPDCGDTSFFGQDIDGNGLPNFCGTSAAAPAVAAAAARLLTKCPALTPSQVKQILTGSSSDINPVGYDKFSGWGLPRWSAVPATCP